ncbi:MAG: hypothetical protein UH788_04645 [Treponemataceae bacterium]|nr:hypothetical protein [Treponemataceae bacterium]
MSSFSLLNLKEYFHERKTLIKNENIFFPNNKFLYILIISLQIIPILIAGLINYKYFFERMSLLIVSFVQSGTIILFILVFGLLLIETSARHVAVYNGTLIQRSYFFKKEIINISNIKNCKITSGRNKGEAVVNLKILGDKKENEININMVAYQEKEIKKICELIGYPELIKDEKEITPNTIKKKRRKQIKTIRICLNILLTCLLFILCSEIIIFIIRKILYINNQSTIDIIARLFVVVSLIGGLRFSSFINYKTKKKSISWLIVACIVILSLFLGLIWLVNN